MITKSQLKKRTFIERSVIHAANKNSPQTFKKKFTFKNNLIGRYDTCKKRKYRPLILAGRYIGRSISHIRRRPDSVGGIHQTEEDVSSLS